MIANRESNAKLFSTHIVRTDNRHSDLFHAITRDRYRGIDMSGIDGILPAVQSRIPCHILLLPWDRAVRRLLLQLSDIRLSGRQLAIGIKLILGRSERARFKVP